MMTERLAFDTNAVIYLVEGVEPYRAWLADVFASVQAGERTAVVSTVTEADAFVKPMRSRNRDHERRLRAFFGAHIEVVDVSREVAQRAARVRADLELTLPDAIIVATAMVAGCDAIIGNDKKCATRVRDIPYVYLDDVVTRH